VGGSKNEDLKSTLAHRGSIPSECQGHKKTGRPRGKEEQRFNKLPGWQAD